MNFSGSVLVTGGAGYIGSHVAMALRDESVPVVVLDDLSTGTRAALPEGVEFVHGSTGDRELVRSTLRAFRVRTVLHIAGSLIVSESIDRPINYWRNNLCNTLSLAESCVEAGVRQMVFSSTAAVYGPSSGLAVDEQAALAPISPYGSSKLAAERMLTDLATAHGLRLAILRYFNVAGSDARGRIGQRTPGASHLIKVACEAATGQRPTLDVFGSDYETPDGTCIRDFIHVSDLADAHVLALRYLEDGGPTMKLNCGYGTGHSVRSVIRAVEAETGRRLPVRFRPRRPGDIPALVARADLIRRVLGWTPCRFGLDQIVGSSLRWERRLLSERLMATD